MKRANGTGSVYKLSGKRRKSWAVCISKGYDDKGKRKRIVIATYETKTAAMKALAQYDLSPSERPNIKLKEIYKEWSEIKYKRIAKSTKENYVAAYKKLSTLHNRKFASLRTANYQVIVDELAKEQSRSSLEKLKALIGLLYKYAMMNDIVTKNYAEFIVLPKSETAEKECFTDVHVKKMFNNDDDDIVKIILIMIYTGFRPGATLDLTRFSYDAEYRVLRGGIKTEAGINRPVPVHPKIQKYIDYFLSLKGERLICTSKGEAYDLRDFRENYYYVTLKRLGLPKLVPHRCRHTFISRLQMAGAKDVSILKLGGHRDYSFTSNTYTHLEIQNLRDDLEKVD